MSFSREERHEISKLVGQPVIALFAAVEEKAK